MIRARPLLASAVAAAALLAVALPASGSARQANPADALLRYQIDPYLSQRAQGCTHKEQPGAQALGAWLAVNVPEGKSWGIEACRKVRGSRTSWSLHAEGRAIDWRLDI